MVAMISFAKVLNMTVTGEGIEAAEQLAQLHGLPCKLGQGYILASPGL